MTEVIVIILLLVFIGAGLIYGSLPERTVIQGRLLFTLLRLELCLFVARVRMDIEAIKHQKES